MYIRRFAGAALLALLVVPALARESAAQEGIGEYRGATALGLALRRLGTTKRVLMIGAHPDDEDTQLLAALALEQGADVAYLSLTRGEGGQNGIGPELHEGLGLLRSEELLAARRVDGAIQFFGREYDFGFSKTADETFRHWPKEQVIRDVVGVIRHWRPDVVVSVWSGTPRDGHGQHQASGIVAREAFEAAGDSTRFRDLTASGLPFYRPAKFYLSRRGSQDGATLRIAMGDLDPLIGRSPFQLAMASRSRHRSQDMGAPQPAGPRWGYLQRLWPAPNGEETSLWAGVDTTLGQRDPSLAEYDRLAADIRASAAVLDPGALIDRLARAVALLAPPANTSESIGRGSAPAVRFVAANELADARQALALATGVELDAIADVPRLVPGQDATVEVTLWNGGHGPLAVSNLQPRVPAGWGVTALDSTAAPAQVGAESIVRRRFRVHVPADAPPTVPYFLRQPREGDLYRWPEDWSVVSSPFEPAPLQATAQVQVGPGSLPLEREVTFREVDPRQGELRRPVAVVPEVSVLLEPETSILSTDGPAQPLRFRARLTDEGTRPVSGYLRLGLPAGWRAAPGNARLTLAPGEPHDVAVVITPPAHVSGGSVPVNASFLSDANRSYSSGLQLVDYPHVRARPLYHPAESRVRAFALRVPHVRVGYLEGAGEVGPSILEQIGITPSVLTADSLAGANLDRYDVIVTGIRAYEVRKDLGVTNPRLLEYVRRGGTLIVQYNKYELVTGHFTPYPITMANPHDRITDETAPVRVLQPQSPVFNYPNRITAADWNDWVQERGLYFAHTWDPHYTPLLEMSDPGEGPLQGGLLIARYGQGTYVYTALAFFRQLPEGVPGAWRLFANLLALGEKRH